MRSSGCNLGKKCPPVVRFMKRGVGGSVLRTITLLARRVKGLDNQYEEIPLLGSLLCSSLNPLSPLRKSPRRSLHYGGGFCT